MANISTAVGMINILSKKGTVMTKEIGDEITKGIIEINDNWYYGFHHIDEDSDMIPGHEVYSVPSFYGSGRWNFTSTIESVMKDEEIKNMMNEIMTKHGIETLAMDFEYDDYELGVDWIDFGEFFGIEYNKTEKGVETSTSYIAGSFYRFSEIATSEEKLSKVLEEQTSFFDIEEFYSYFEDREEREVESNQPEEETVKEETPTDEIKEEVNGDDK